VDLPDKNLYMDTYPEWSPDGEYMYFCRADQIGEEYDYQDIKYNLCRVSFDPASRTFGEVELVFDAASSGKSVSFPRVSPNGTSLVFTYHDYGCFPIWHKEADLYSVDLENLSVKPLNVNSDYTDSYHSWSSSGNWLVFSSKRDDGLTARPYIAYVDENGREHKPFVLPQKDPEFYNRFIRTFNRPEFATSKISLNPGRIRRISREAAIQANWAQN
jgi:Tol biopolymer transport system component